MNSKKLDLITYIGRFQPFHSGHQYALRTALSKASHVLLLIGSSGEPSSLRNPWSFRERTDMIRSCVSADDWKRITIQPLTDMTYNDAAWAAQVQQLVDECCNVVQKVTVAVPPTVGMLCPKKDLSTSAYLEMFPQYTPVQCEISPCHTNASDIRRQLFGVFSQLPPDGVVHYKIRDFLFDYMVNNVGYTHLQDETSFDVAHAKMWESSPYPPTFNTVDAVVIQSGHILLIRRKFSPGKGMYALPGGYLNQDETLLNGMIRELREETGIKVPEKVLRGSIVQTKTFDDPNRSSRGRIITQAYHIQLNGASLPIVRGEDDADKAEWFTLNEFLGMRCVMFEDHYAMIKSMLGI